MVAQYLIRTAIAQAEKSLHRYYRMGAVVWRKKNVIAVGHNVPRKHVPRTDLPLRYRRYPSSIHAEMDALLSANTEVKGAAMLVLRVSANGSLREAFPCPFCLTYLQHVGLRKVYYSTSEGTIEVFYL